MIPLGADYSTDNFTSPFNITANNALGKIPGTTYWVTTSIARFDPAVDWPSDLEVIVKINRDLTSVSGKALVDSPAFDEASLARVYKTDTQTLSVGVRERTHHTYKELALHDTPLSLLSVCWTSARYIRLCGPIALSS